MAHPVVCIEGCGVQYEKYREEWIAICNVQHGGRIPYGGVGKEYGGS